jgi:uncharacterized protein YgiM (DUF1202 family)
MKLMTVIFAILFANLANAQYIKSVKAKVMTEASNSSPVKFELNQGEEIKELAVDKNWIQIEHTQRQGWVPKLLISKDKPLKIESALSKGEDISGNARSRASAMTSAGAARGLMQDNSNMLSSLKGVDMKAVQKLESFYVDPRGIKQ